VVVGNAEVGGGELFFTKNNLVHKFEYTGYLTSKLPSRKGKQHRGAGDHAKKKQGRNGWPIGQGKLNVIEWDRKTKKSSRTRGEGGEAEGTGL